MRNPYKLTYRSWSCVAGASWYWRQFCRLLQGLHQRMLTHLIIWAIVPNADGHICGTDTHVDGWIL